MMDSSCVWDSNEEELGNITNFNLKHDDTEPEQLYCDAEDVFIPFTGRIYPPNYSPSAFTIFGLPFWEDTVEQY